MRMPTRMSTSARRAPSTSAPSLCHTWSMRAERAIRPGSTSFTLAMGSPCDDRRPVPPVPPWSCRRSCSSEWAQLACIVLCRMPRGLARHPSICRLGGLALRRLLTRVCLLLVRSGRGALRACAASVGATATAPPSGAVLLDVEQEPSCEEGICCSSSASRRR